MADLFQFECEIQRRFVLFRALLIRVAEAAIDEAHIEPSPLGFGDGTYLFDHG